MSDQPDTRGKWLSALLLILISTPVIINTAVLAIDSLNSTNFSGIEITKKVSTTHTIEIWGKSSIQFEPESGSIRISLMTDQNVSLSGQFVNLSYSGFNQTQSLMLETNQNGQIILELKPGEYWLNASFAGAEFIKGSSLSQNFEITKTLKTEPENVTKPKEQVQEKPIDYVNFSVDMFYPDIVVRGAEFQLAANITNVGTEVAENLSVEWLLADGFQVLDDAVCPDLGPQESCLTIVSVVSTAEAGHGIQQAKLVVSSG